MGAYQPQRRVHHVWLREGSTVSEKINIGRETLVGFRFPVGFESSTVSFMNGDEENGDYFPLYDPVSNTAVTVYSAAGKDYQIHAGDLSLLQYFQIVAPSAATEDRLIIVYTRATA